MVASIQNWQWPKRPGAHFEGGLLIADDSREPIFYYPGQYQIQLINSVIKICDEKSAVQFAEDWGLLGIRADIVNHTKISNRIMGATNYLLYKKNWQPLSTAEEVEIKNLFGYQHPRLRGDSLQDILHFAKRTKYLAEIKHILALYKEDPIAAEYEADQWVKESEDDMDDLDLVRKFNFLTEQFKRGGYGNDVNRFLLYNIMHNERSSFSHRSKRCIWVEVRESPIYNPDASEIRLSLNFSSLARFIEYSLLIGINANPKICADPKCRQIFFPEKTDQKYCPPPPGVKRSRCEGRHSQELKRNKARGQPRK